MIWEEEIGDAITAFLQVAKLGGIALDDDDLAVEVLRAPHKPPSKIPSSRMAVYAFWGDGEWLKVGKVGPNSHARYSSQHYSAGSAPSTLAASLQKCVRVRLSAGFDVNDPGGWTKANCHRVNILLDANQPRELLALLEAFLHLRLRPRYEGSTG